MSWRTEVDWLVRAGSKKIYAVIGVREALRCSLKEAKDAVDGLPSRPVYLGNPCPEDVLERMQRSPGLRVRETPGTTLWDHLLGD
jgi:predicted secreted protein